jgi:hypothetical protein
MRDIHCSISYILWSWSGGESLEEVTLSQNKKALRKKKVIKKSNWRSNAKPNSSIFSLKVKAKQPLPSLRTSSFTNEL